MKKIRITSLAVKYEPNITKHGRSFNGVNGIFYSSQTTASGVAPKVWGMADFWVKKGTLGSSWTLGATLHQAKGLFHWSGILQRS